MKRFILSFAGLTLAILSHPVLLSANEVYQAEATQLVLPDATPVDPGHVEWVNTYSIKGSGRQWTEAGRKKRSMLREHLFQSAANVGLMDRVDFGIAQGFSVMRDKANNYDETGGATDPDTGESLDVTDGPHQGFGRTDLTVNLRWLMYRSKDTTLRVAHIPTLVIPTGRRGNLDHLGPSQNYATLDNTVVVTKDKGRASMSMNAGYNAPLANPNKRGSSAGTFTAGVGAGYHVLDWIKPNLEFLYTQDVERFSKDGKSLSVAAGLIMPVHEHLRFDVGIQQDLLGSRSDQATSGIFKLVFLV